MDLKGLQKLAEDHLHKFLREKFGIESLSPEAKKSLQRIVIFFILGTIFCIWSIFFVIVPGTNQIISSQTNIDRIVRLLHGEGPDKPGKINEKNKLQNELSLKEEDSLEIKTRTINELKDAIYEDINKYNIATYLEDYSITMSTTEKPIIIKGLSFGKEKEVSILAKDLKQSIDIPVNMLELEGIFGEDQSSWPQQLFERSQNGEYFFKSNLSTEDFLALEEKQQRAQIQKLYANFPKISVNAEYRELPITITLEAHREQFEQLVDFIYYSGSTGKYLFKGKPVPLMSVESLNLPVKIEESTKNIDDTEEQESLVSSYTLKANMYFQKDLNAKPNNQTKQ